VVLFCVMIIAGDKSYDHLRFSPSLESSSEDSATFRERFSVLARNGTCKYTLCYRTHILTLRSHEHIILAGIPWYDLLG
jgi:hypothetical protein